jgi:GT2 family glycosyltransferase
VSGATSAAVVVCCRDRADLLAGALPAITAVLRRGDEVVVVDSASHDDSVAAVARQGGVTVVRCEQPGVSRARNAGWRSTTHPVVLFTDDDCRPQPGWVEAAVAALAADRVGVVWGLVRADAESGVALSVLDDTGPLEGSLTGDLSALGHGANLALRRETLEEVGGFDEAIGPGAHFPAAEDKDLLWRVMRAGWRARFAPGMAVTHVQWRGVGAAVRVMYRYGVGAGVVAGKRRRVDGERGLVGGEVMRHGVRHARRMLLAGKPAAATAAMARAAGVVVGAWQVRRMPLDGAHLRPRPVNPPRGR